MADHQHIQLEQTSPRGSSVSENTAGGGAEDEAGMCRALYLAVCKGKTENVMLLLLQRQHSVIDNTAGIGQISRNEEANMSNTCCLFIHSRNQGFTGQHEQCNILEVSAGKNTVLHIAAEKGHDDLILEICKRFNDKDLLSSRNSAMDTPLHCAARAGRHTTVSLLVELIREYCGEEEESILGYTNEAGDTALHLAASHRYRYDHGHAHTMAVETLVSESAAAVVNSAGMSALYLAVVSKSVPAVAAIITKCRDASSKGPSSQNALHAAVFQGSEMVNTLVTRKPDLASQGDDNGSTPLHFASSDGHVSIVKAILKSALPRIVYKKDASGVSALHVAALMGHKNIVEKLIEDFPDAAELRDDHGRTFLHVAVAAQKSRRCSVMSLAIKNTMLRGLLNAKDGDGNTPLHLAIAAGSTYVVEALLRKGKVGVDVFNNDGHTALDLAKKSTSFFTKVSMVVTLVAFGAQMRPQKQENNQKQWSDLDIARKEKASDSLAVVAVLIATVAFAAGFNMPGTYGDNNSDKGMANLKDKDTFKFFLVLDTVAMAASVVTVILLVYGKASRSPGSWTSFVAALHCMWVSLVSLIVAFYAALRATAGTDSDAISIVYFCIYNSIAVLIVCITYWIHPITTSRTTWTFLWRMYAKRQARVIKMQYPYAGVYVLNVLLFYVTNCIAYLGVTYISTL